MVVSFTEILKTHTLYLFFLRLLPSHLNLLLMVTWTVGTRHLVTVVRSLGGETKGLLLREKRRILLVLGM